MALVLVIVAVATALEVGRRRDADERAATRAGTSTSTTTTTSPPGVGPAPSVPPDLVPVVVPFPDADDAVATVDPSSPEARGPSYRVDRQLVRVPAPSGERSSLAAVVVDGDSADRLLLRLRPQGGGAEVVGASPALGEEAGQQGRLVVAGTTSFVRTRAQVLSFAPDGTRLAAVPLARTDGPTCPRCDLAVGDLFVTTDVSGRFVALDGRSAEPVWERGLGVGPLDVDTVGDALVVVHEVDGELAVSDVDGATGTIRRATAVPCGREVGIPVASTPSTVLRRIPGTTAVVVAVVAGGGQLCAARMDPGTGDVAWSIGIDVEVGNLGSEPVVEDGLLVLHLGRGSAWIDLDTGAFRSRTPEEQPLRVSVGAGLVVMEGRNGAGVGHIWAADRDSGKVAWSIEPDPTFPGLGDDDGRVQVVAEHDRLHAVVLDVGQRRLTIHDLDPASGVPLGARAFALPDPLDPGGRGFEGTLFVRRTSPERVVVGYGPWLAEVPLSGTDGAWVWTAG